MIHPFWRWSSPVTRERSTSTGLRRISNRHNGRALPLYEREHDRAEANSRVCWCFLFPITWYCSSQIRSLGLQQQLRMLLRRVDTYERKADWQKSPDLWNSEMDSSRWQCTLSLSSPHSLVSHRIQSVSTPSPVRDIRHIYYLRNYITSLRWECSSVVLVITSMARSKTKIYVNTYVCTHTQRSSFCLLLRNAYTFGHLEAIIEDTFLVSHSKTDLETKCLINRLLNT